MIYNLPIATFDEPEYVQDGLILHLDGINNTPNGHDATSTTWYDLSGNGYNFTKDSGASFGDKYLLVNGQNNGAYLSSAPSSILGTSLWDNRTIEVVVEATQLSSLLMGTSASGKCAWISKYNDKINVSFENGTDNVGYSVISTLDFDSNYSLKHTFTWGYSSSTPFGVIDGGNFITAVGYDMDVWRANSNIYIGYRNGSAYDTKGKIYSIRVYNRLLTQDEIVSNYAVDLARFV